MSPELIAIIAVGMVLAGLMLRGQHGLDKRVDGIDKRLDELRGDMGEMRRDINLRLDGFAGSRRAWPRSMAISGVSRGGTSRRSPQRLAPTSKRPGTPCSTKSPPGSRRQSS